MHSAGQLINLRTYMEENSKKPGGLFDEENLLVDRAIRDPFQPEQAVDAVQLYPFDDGRDTGYIRYILTKKSVVILDYFTTQTGEPD